MLRAILCISQAKWEMENFEILTPPPTPLKFCMQLDIVGGCLKMHFVRVATLLLSSRQWFLGGEKTSYLTQKLF